MIALVAALLLAQAPAQAPAAGSRDADAKGAPAARERRPPRPPAAAPPARGGDRSGARGASGAQAEETPAPRRDPDEAVIRELDLLENLGLLEELELFDPACDPPPRPPRERAKPPPR